MKSVMNINEIWISQAAVDSAVAMNDLAVIVDLLGILTLKPYVNFSIQITGFSILSISYCRYLLFCSQNNVELGPVQFSARSN